MTSEMNHRGTKGTEKMPELPIVSCETCGGKCCSHMRSPPFVRSPGDGASYEDDRLWESLTAAQREQIDDRIMSDADEDAPCLWLKEGRCEHYEQRPQICRDFEIGGADCQSWQK